MARKVVIVEWAGVQSLDLVRSHEVFSDTSLLNRGIYDVAIASIDDKPVTTATGLAFMTVPLPDPSNPVATALLHGSSDVDSAQANAELVVWIKSMSCNSHRLVTTCTGAFFAAEAGLLNNHRATRYWAFVVQLASTFSTIDVDSDPIFIRSAERMRTATGITAGIKLALSLVER